MARALLLIDLSRDFIDLDGSLNCGVSGQAIVPYCQALVRDFVTARDLIIDTRDAHTLDDFEIASGLFAPHNLIGTAGQELIPEIVSVLEAGPARWVQVPKKHYNALYRTELTEILKVNKIHELHVIGVCTDICVRYTVNGLYEFKASEYPDLHVVVHAGGVASFNQAGHVDSLLHMPGAFGVEVV